MIPFDFLRLAKNTPPSVPPAGYADIKFDADTGGFIQVNPDGSSESLGGGSTPDPSATVEAVSGTSYELSSADNGKVLNFTSGSAVTVSVPDGLGAGFNVALVQSGAGVVTLDIFGGVTVNSIGGAVAISDRYGVASLVAVAADSFIFSGAIA